MHTATTGHEGIAQMLGVQTQSGGEHAARLVDQTCLLKQQHHVCLCSIDVWPLLEISPSIRAHAWLVTPDIILILTSHEAYAMAT